MKEKHPLCGKSYRPSSGSEGERFHESFCYQCIHEKWVHNQKDDRQEDKCDIMSRAMLFNKTEEGFPTEWQHNETGRPTCTAWVKWDWDKDDDGNWNDPPKPDPIDPMQLVIPFEEDEWNNINELELSNSQV